MHGIARPSLEGCELVHGIAHAERGRLFKAKAHGVLASHLGAHAVHVDLREVREGRVPAQVGGVDKRLDSDRVSVCVCVCVCVCVMKEKMGDRQDD